jgi:hypothetical protein
VVAVTAACGVWALTVGAVLLYVPARSGRSRQRSDRAASAHLGVHRSSGGLRHVCHWRLYGFRFRGYSLGAIPFS